MANGLEMSPEELARLLEEVGRHRGRPLPPPPPGWTLAAWLRFLGAAGLLAFSIWFLVKRSRGAYHDKYDVAPLPLGVEFQQVVPEQAGGWRAVAER